MMSTILDYIPDPSGSGTDEAIADPDGLILIDPLPMDENWEVWPIDDGLWLDGGEWAEPGVSDEWIADDMLGDWQWIEGDPVEYTEDMIAWSGLPFEGEPTDGWIGDEGWLEGGEWVDPGDGDTGFAEIPELWCGPCVEGFPFDPLLEGGGATEPGDGMNSGDGVWVKEMIPVRWCGTEVPPIEPTDGEGRDGELSEPIGGIGGWADGEILPLFHYGMPTALEESGRTGSRVPTTIPISVEPEGVIYIDEMPRILDDETTGTSGADRLVGNPLANGLSGGAGNDTLEGQGGDDILSGDQGNDRLDGGSGNDRLLGGTGRDTLNGGAGTDNLQGGDGDDLLQGGAGQDFLRGDRGNDTLLGGEGADVFILQPGQGTDLIADFQDGRDKLGLLGEGLVAEQLSFIQVGQHTLVQANNTVLAILQGVSASALSLDDIAPVLVVV